MSQPGVNETSKTSLGDILSSQTGGGWSMVFFGVKFFFRFTAEKTCPENLSRHYFFLQKPYIADVIIHAKKASK